MPRPRSRCAIAEQFEQHGNKPLSVKDLLSNFISLLKKAGANVPRIDFYDLPESEVQNSQSQIKRNGWSMQTTDIENGVRSFLSSHSIEISPKESDAENTELVPGEIRPSLLANVPEIYRTDPNNLNSIANRVRAIVN